MRHLGPANVKKEKDVEDNRKEYGKPGVMLVCPRLWPPQSKPRQETNNMRDVDVFSDGQSSTSVTRSMKGSQAVLAVGHSERASRELLFETAENNIESKLECFPRRGKLMVGIVEGQNLRKTSEHGKYESLLEAPPRVLIVAKFGL